MKSSGPAIADVDGERIRQVFDNLLRNVSEHTKPGTTVEVDVYSTDEAVTIRVSDSGAGIPNEDCKHLFQRFWRADPANRLAAGSSGLGLAITESIVTAHNGSIAVRSSEAEGTTFTIELPL